MTVIGPEDVETILEALSAQLAALEAPFELVVIGGTALQALGFVTRGTRDVDVVAIKEGGVLLPAEPLPEPLRVARDRVARDFNLPQEWLNAGPTELLRFGLPKGFLTRTSSKRYGSALTVHFAGRLDQIHFKLYAVVDQAGGRHEADLHALAPTPDELRAAALWATTHDPSEGFRSMLRATLHHLGVEPDDNLRS